ncbi:hypothetical protein [Pantoea agglomerans]|uniref:hypothetical protein n=1 Tax=Enterobacter agglomerans TaxID=549 RepID=UPI003209ED3F
MSLSDAKKLEDLKQQAKENLDAYYAGFAEQRRKAIVSALSEMSAYLQEQGFDVKDRSSPLRGFVATYKDINILAEPSKDDESFIGADYVINFTVGKKKTQVSLLVKRAKRINPPHEHEGVLQQINDYENRYIPEIKSLDPLELDGSYKLSVIEVSGNARMHRDLVSGRNVIDYLFEK